MHSFAQAAILDVKPPSALRDTKLTKFKITGLAPGQIITVDAIADSLPGSAPWTSTAQFQANANGNVNLKKQAPLSGSYTGADIMGLLWSLSSTDTAIVDRMLLGGVAMGNFNVTLTVKDGGGQVLATTSIARLSARPNHPVIHEVYAPLGYNIQLFYPDPADRPAKATIIHLTGSGGGTLDGYCEMVAAHGYMAACVPWFGEPGTAPALAAVPLEFFQTAIQSVLAHPAAVGNEVIIGGASYGAITSLLVANTYPELVKGVLPFVPANYVVEGLTPPPLTPQSAWTLGGTELPFIPWRWDVWFETIAAGPPPWYLRPMAEASIATATPEELAAALLPVSAIDGPVFLSGAVLDGLWPGDQAAQELASRLEAAGNTDVQVFIGEDAGHTLFSPAYTPLPRTDAGGLALGGSSEGNVQDIAAMWSQLLEFLSEEF